MKKILYIFLGSISLGLGVLGIILPILPTTPFLLLSAYFYLKSSNQLYNWLINHRLFGKYIYNYVTYKAIPLKAKVSALILLWITILFSSYLIANTIVTLILIAIAITVSIYLISLTTLKEEGKSNEQSYNNQARPIEKKV